MRTFSVDLKEVTEAQRVGVRAALLMLTKVGTSATVSEALYVCRQVWRQLSAFLGFL